jgi:CheY-like chemotaxis protein
MAQQHQSTPAGEPRGRAGGPETSAQTGAGLRFLADLSHELRSPLNSIIGLADLLCDGDDPLTAEQRTQVEYIHRMANDQLRLVGELLDIAKIEAGRTDVQLGLISVQNLFAHLRGELAPLVAGGGVTMTFVCEPELPRLICDEAKLTQIVSNLVRNAVKYTVRGEIVISAARVRDRLELSVADTGAGIPADAVAGIFDAFVQVPGEHQRRAAGTGLGLSLTRRLAELLDGVVEVTSTPGEGSRFLVRLPWRTPGPLSAEPETSPGGETPARGVLKSLALVLVADDDANVRLSVARRLEPVAVEVAGADTGAAAIAFAAARRPSVVVLDLSMPDMSGFEVLERMRAIPGLEELPVVIHSSRDLTPQEDARLQAARGSCVDKYGHASPALAAAVLAAVEKREHG